MGSKIKDTGCLCLVASLAQGAVGGANIKEALIAFCDIILVYLNYAKQLLILANYETIDDRIQLALLQLTQAQLAALVDPIKTRMSTLSASFSAYADCGPIGTLSSLTRKITDPVLGKYEELENIIDSKIIALSEIDDQSELMDRWIGFITEVKKTLQDFCGVPP